MQKNVWSQVWQENIHGVLLEHIAIARKFKSLSWGMEGICGKSPGTKAVVAAVALGQVTYSIENVGMLIPHSLVTIEICCLLFLISLACFQWLFLDFLLVSDQLLECKPTHLLVYEAVCVCVCLVLMLEWLMKSDHVCGWSRTCWCF